MSACLADISWVLPQPSLLTVTIPSFIAFEVSFGGPDPEEWEWVGIGGVNVNTQQQPQPTSFRAMIPPNGVNTNYSLRARSENSSVGVGPFFNEPDTFIAYMEGGQVLKIHNVMLVYAYMCMYMYVPTETN